MYELVGYRYVDMVSGGDVIKGHSCFFVNHEEQEGLVGCEAFKQYLSDEKFPDFQPVLHGRYLLIYNQKGKISDVVFRSYSDEKDNEDAA